MTLYEVNQQNYQELPTMTQEELQDELGDIELFIRNTDAGYYMLLCNELHYYTLYTWEYGLRHAGIMSRDLLDLIQDLGEIKSIEVKEDRIEVWISNDEVCNMYLFFPYDRGVIKV